MYKRSLAFLLSLNVNLWIHWAKAENFAQSVNENSCIQCIFIYVSLGIILRGFKTLVQFVWSPACDETLKKTYFSISDRRVFHFSRWCWEAMVCHRVEWWAVDLSSKWNWWLRWVEHEYLFEKKVVIFTKKFMGKIWNQNWYFNCLETLIILKDIEDTEKKQFIWHKRWGFISNKLDLAYFKGSFSDFYTFFSQ